MYVVAEHAGEGIGKSLLQALIVQARSTTGLEQLLLTVTASNARAKQLYESIGFEMFGVEPRAIKVGAQYFDKAHMILFL
jgi:L-amino acid N-acyltransferase YncA